MTHGILAPLASCLLLCSHYYVHAQMKYRWTVSSRFEKEPLSLDSASHDGYLFTIKISLTAF